MWSKLQSALDSCICDEQGQVLAEYGMVLALVALGAIIAANFGNITAAI